MAQEQTRWGFSSNGHTSAPVGDEGSVVFMSLDTFALPFESPEQDDPPGSADYDVFLSHEGGLPTPLSVYDPGRQPDFDGPDGPVDQVGECREVVARHGLLVEVRDPPDANAFDEPSEQYVFWRDFEHETATLLPTPEGTVCRFLNLAGTETSAWLVFSARKEDGPYGLYRQHFVRDSTTESWSPNGVLLPILPEASGDCVHPSVRSDGNGVAFLTDVRLTTDDGDDSWDVYLWQDGNEVACLTTSFAGDCQETCIVPADGQTVYFTGQDGAGQRQVYAVHTQTRAWDPISAPPLALETGAGAWFPRCSDDGRFLVFLSGEGSGGAPVMLWDRRAGRVVECLTRDGAESPQNRAANGPEISPSGRFVSYSTTATELTGDADGVQHVVRVDRGSDFGDAAPVGTDRHLRCRSGSTVALPVSAWDYEEDALETQIQQRPNVGTLLDDPGDGWHGGSDVLPLHLSASENSGSLSELRLQVRQENPIPTLYPATSTISIETIEDNPLVADAIPGAPGSPSGRTDLRNFPIPMHGTDRIAVDAYAHWIAYTVKSWTDEDQLRKTLFLFNSGAGNYWKLAHTESSNPFTPVPVAIAADGSAVAWCADGALSWAPLRNGVLAKGLTRRADAPGCGRLAVSRMGRFVAFDRTEADAATEIVVWAADSGETTVLASGNGAAPTISDSGEIVAWVGTDGASVELAFRAAQSDGWQPRGFRTLGPFSAGVGDLTCSRNGRFLAFAHEHAVEILDIGNAETVGTVDTLSGFDSPAFSRGGGFVYVRKGDGGHAYRYAVQSGELTQLSDVAAQRGQLAGRGQTCVFSAEPGMLGGDQPTRKLVRIDFGLPADPSAPEGHAQSLRTDEDTALPLTLEASDTDVEDQDLSLAVSVPPQHGHVAPRFARMLPLWTYVPNADWNGNDEFTVTIADAAGHRSAQTFAVRVDAVNDPPNWAGLSDSIIIFAGEQLDLRDWVHDPDVNDTPPDQLAFRNNGLPIGPVLKPDDHLELNSLTVRDQLGATISAPHPIRIEVAPPLDIPLEPGWNAVCFPVTLSQEAAERILVDFSRRIWQWKGQAYLPVITVDELVNATGKGLWIYRGDAAPPSISVPADSSDIPAAEVAVEPGWNCIGAVGARLRGQAPESDRMAWRWDAQRQLHVPVGDAGIERGWAYWYWSDDAEPRTVEVPLDAWE